jgi:hypothetical protein
MSAAQVLILSLIPVGLLVGIGLAMEREQGAKYPSNFWIIVVSLSLAALMSIIFGSRSGCAALEFFSMSDSCDAGIFLNRCLFILHVITVLGICVAIVSIFRRKRRAN